jgi:hypothetical protein
VVHHPDDPIASEAADPVILSVQQGVEAAPKVEVGATVKCDCTAPCSRDMETEGLAPNAE